MDEKKLKAIIDNYQPFVSFTPDDVIAEFENQHSSINDYRKELYNVNKYLGEYVRKGLIEKRNDQTYINHGRLARPSKNERIGQILDELEADGVRTMYASTISRVCGYSRNDVVEYVKNGDRARFRNCTPSVGGKSEVWFLRNIGQKKSDTRRKNLSGKLRSADEMANIMVNTLRQEFDIPNETVLADLKIKMLPTLMKIMDQ